MAFNPLRHRVMVNVLFYGSIAVAAILGAGMVTLGVAALFRIAFGRIC